MWAVTELTRLKVNLGVGAYRTEEGKPNVLNVVRRAEQIFVNDKSQRFASGNLDADAQSIHMFVVDGGECLAAQSYARNMRLYGERVDALSIVCKDTDVASRVESQLKLVIRPVYSNSPIHGASIVATTLKDRQMYDKMDS
ncbi:hypothetical protein RND71_035844 [Anisodus tanguticus]|uniref:Aminotransferase class I/classII large domain-containing protein n=1 Tax=Anisodus tanguticus TaxID=243964 RepID=A0AAE1UUT8_9SOLA|nr:hypothetical protein RND71_035844 [Anisodus tanguticus]